MSVEVVLESVGVGAVVLLSYWETLRVEATARVRRGRALGSSEARRCPYCRGEFAEEERPTVRCAACATAQHADCWEEHGRCSVFACGSLEQGPVAGAEGDLAPNGEEPGDGEPEDEEAGDEEAGDEEAPARAEVDALEAPEVEAGAALTAATPCG